MKSTPNPVKRPLRTVGEFLRLVDEKGREDRIFLLASGIAFNLLLAFIPLLVVTLVATAFVLGRSSSETVAQITDLIAALVPLGPDAEAGLRGRVAAILEGAPTALSIGTVAFVWLSTRLFGSLRVVLAEVFDIEDMRHPVVAKLFDMKMAIVSSFFLMLYFTISAYLTIATGRGVLLLETLGIRSELMGNLEYNAGRALAFSFILVTFFLIYRYMPHRKVRVRTALVAAAFTSVMFEFARLIFVALAPGLNPGSIYSGLAAAGIVLVVWVYYVALIFVLGGEVSQVYDLLRARRVQRVVFE